MRKVAALIMAVGVGMFIAAPSWAQSVFDIPAMPLDEALRRYSHATRLSVIYESRLIQGRQSTPIQGTYTPQAALDLLLTGTGFGARGKPLCSPPA